MLAFRKSSRWPDQGAELYVNERGAKTGVVALGGAQLLQETSLTAFLRHELMHLQDMVDPRFGYVPELPSVRGQAGRQRLALERYRLLWDVTIDARLAGAGKATVTTEAQRLAEFSAAFAFWSESRQRKVFGGLWS